MFSTLSAYVGNVMGVVGRERCMKRGRGLWARTVVGCILRAGDSNRRKPNLFDRFKDSTGFKKYKSTAYETVNFVEME
jgi:hypothetical protein